MSLCRNHKEQEVNLIHTEAERTIFGMLTRKLQYEAASVNKCIKLPVTFTVPAQQIQEFGDSGEIAPEEGSQ